MNSMLDNRLVPVFYNISQSDPVLVVATRTKCMDEMLTHDATNLELFSLSGLQSLLLV